MRAAKPPAPPARPDGQLAMPFVPVDAIHATELMGMSTATWQPREAPPALPVGTVHVWRLGLEGHAAAWRRLLSEEEAERAEAFREERHRRRFVRARGQLRALLAGYVDAEAAALRFAYGERGKPRLAGPASDLHFNLAHSGDLGLCAVSRDRALGIDLERIRPVPEAERLAERHFGREELERWRAAAPEARQEAFLRIWARKEALLKAEGSGLAVPPSRVDSLRGLAPTAAGSGERRGWWLCDLRPAPGYVGALATAGGRPSLLTWRYAVGEAT